MQFNGVDEGDIVKNDGTHIYSIDQRTKEIIITKANPADDMAVVAKIAMEKQFQPQQLYLRNARLIVIGQSYNQPAFYKNKLSADSQPVDRPYQASVVKAIVYDVEDKENPTFVREFELEGSMTDTRMIDGNLYLVANSQPPLSYGDIENVDLRPFYRDTAVSEDVNVVPYKEIEYIPGDPKANYTIVASFDVEAEMEPEITTYLGGTRQVYMSKESLYLAITNNSFEPTGEHEQKTDILKFAISGGKIEYDASTTVSGWLINQFAMDERNGYFRVATTKGFARNNNNQSENQLYVLDSTLEKVGEVNNIARGEQIYSVRFMEDRAYIVTFKTVDPLFVIDLKEPENPEILGELKIPGFSTYLHPYDENHVIGFGVNTKELENPNQTEPRVVRDGMKISLFDITDVNNPKEKFTEIIQGQGTNSELINNHKALMYDGQKGLFAFPITIYDKQSVFQGAHVYGVDLENGFDLKTKITHQKENSRYPNWEDAISRILYIDDQLYTLSPSKIKAHNIENFNFINEIELK
jgi:inhibitor of cysteine peptidase